MKLLILALAASAALISEDRPAKEEVRPQPIPAASLDHFQKLQNEFAVLEYKLCNGAGLLRQDCIVNWQAGLILKKPAPKPPVEPASKEPAK